MKNDILSYSVGISFPNIDLENVKGVLIDLDNTLYHFFPAHQSAMEKVCTYFNQFVSVSKDDFEKAYKAAWQAGFDRLGAMPLPHNRLIIFQAMAEKWGIAYPFLVADKAYHLYFDTVFSSIRPNKEAKDFLRQCKKKKIPVCLVTDLFEEIQIKKLKKLKMEKLISFIVSNDEVGADKPHPEMFLRALAKLGLSAKDVIMVGDEPIKDVAGAQRLGIKAYRVAVHK